MPPEELGDHVAHGAVVQLPVESFAIDQLAVCALLDLLSAREDDNLVGVDDRLQPMSDHDARSVFGRLVQGLLHQLLGLVVEGACGCNKSLN